MAKICKNCACEEVCFHMNPCRTEDCKLWQPKVVYCYECIYKGHDAWCEFVEDEEGFFCKSGERKSENG